MRRKKKRKKVSRAAQKWKNVRKAKSFWGSEALLENPRVRLSPRQSRLLFLRALRAPTRNYDAYQKVFLCAHKRRLSRWQLPALRGMARYCRCDFWRWERVARYSILIRNNQMAQRALKKMIDLADIAKSLHWQEIFEASKKWKGGEKIGKLIRARLPQKMKQVCPGEILDCLLNTAWPPELRTWLENEFVNMVENKLHFDDKNGHLKSIVNKISINFLVD